MKLNAELISRAYQKLSLESSVPLAVQVEVVAEIGSTNLDLMQRAKNLTMPTLLVAENQTAGRGRAGRSWLSIADGVLTFSLAWFFSKKAQQLSGLPLVVGVALAEKLLEIGVPVQLKWPNDLLKEKKKLGGILVETQAAGEQGIWAIIGIGLNLMIPDELEARIGQAVADAPWLAQMDRNDLLAHLLHALSTAMRVFDEYGFEVFVDRWNRLHAHAQLPVCIVDAGMIQKEGIALGIDGAGCLLLQTTTGVLAVHSGDVSLRASL